MTDKLLEKTWERIQQKTFTKWCNMHLGKRGKAIENIDEDFKSGINLIVLLEVIGAESLGKYNQKPVMKIHNIENINRALKYIADKGVKLWGIAAEDIFDGNRKLILGMIWTIILRFAIADISEEELSAKEALLLWCKKKTAGYKDVQVDNFSNSWQDGLAFCALIHAHRPDLIDFDSLSNADPARNLQIAFDVAEKDLGIPKLLDIEDIIDVPKPDERSIMTYISQFYHYFSANRKQEIAGRRIGKLVDMTVSNDQLKNDYNQKAAVHAAWVKSATDKLNERDFDNTLAGIKQRLAEFRQFRSEEKPPKVADKLALENLANSIALKLSHANRPPFQPQAGCSTNELNQAWDALNAAEAARAADLLAELERQEGLDVLKRRFNNKATQLEDWLGKKSDYLQSEESVDTVNAAQRALIVLDAFNEELERSRARLEAVNGLAGKITEQNDKDSAAVQARADAINAAFANLRNLSDSKRASLNTKLGDQKDRESLRMKFAEAATAYKTWVNETTSAASATAFPNTLEGVENFKATLDAQDAEINGQNDSKRDNLGSIWNEIQQLNIKDNRYTVLTFDDINALHQNVVEVLAKRQSDYAAELQRQIELEAKRKEFARAAQEFVDSLAQRRAALEALQGEPLDLIESIKGTYAEGQPDKEKLAAVGELQAELSRLGVADNRHTQLTLPILEVHQSQLAKFVRNRIASLQQEANLKQQYHQRASDLLAWINATLPTINAGAFDNTLEGARAIKNAWNEYKTTVRAQKGVEKINIEGLFNKIAENQAAHNRPAFVPDAGKAIADINALWSQLEEQEKQRETAIYNELSRQEKLFALVKNFNSEADDLEAWAAKQKVYLTAQEDVSTLDDARLKLVNLSVYEEDYNNTQTRLNQVQALKDEINALNYNDVATINARAENLKQLWAELQQLADSKRASLDKSLAEQQSWENMRLAFASAATEFQQFVKDTIENISERNFGTTLNDVESTAATLQQEDSSIRADAERKLQTAQQAWADLQANNVADNRYTDLTVGDLQTSNGDLEAALASRQADYQTELARQRENDAQSQSFAAKTQAFSDWLSSQLKEIRAIQGTTDERTAKINEAYAEGRPAQSQLDDLIAQDNGLRERGIYYNRYLVHTIPSLQKAVQQFNESVSNLLAAIDEEREFNERRQTQEAEWKQKEAIEERGVHFHNAVQDLNLFLDSVYEILTDPINVNSVEGAEKLIADFNEARDQVNGKEGDFQQVLKDGAELKDLVAGVEASTSAIEQKWNSTQDNIRTRDESLQASLATQRRNDELCQHFAQKAQTFSDFINNTKSALSENSAGNIEERLAAVRAIGAQFAEGNAQLEELSQLSERIIEASITANRHTNLTLPELKAQYDELKSSQKDREALLDKELLQEKHSTATPEQIEEFKEVFRHFDRDNKGFLTALQFKSCLQSLGNDPTDADMDRLMGALGQDKPNPSGGDAIKAVEFDRFVEHMIKVTSDTTTQGEIAQSFRDLAGDKDFITEADLRRGLPGDKVDYLIANMPRYEAVADGYDYNAWAASAFSR